MLVLTPFKASLSKSDHDIVRLVYAEANYPLPDSPLVADRLAQVGSGSFRVSRRASAF